MMKPSVAFVTPESETPRRAKPLPLGLRDHGAQPPGSGLPPGLTFRRGARELLLQWPLVRALLTEAGPMLQDLFGARAKLVLERFDDPEAEEPTAQLYLLVSTPMAVDDAMVLFRRFDEQWWIDNVNRAAGRLIIDLEPL